MKYRRVLVALSISLLAAALPAGAHAAEEAALTFNPAPVAFAKTTAGSESQNLTVDIRNTGGAGVAVDQVVVEGVDSGDFKLSGAGCGWLDPEQQCSAWVSFAPGSQGAKLASLVVKLKEAPEQAVALSGEAVPVQLAFVPTSHDFGIQRVNRGEGSATLQLFNVGEAAAQLGSVGIGGANPGNFWTNGGDCWGGRWLQPGESCNVQVGFNPWETVAYEAELQAQAHGTTFGAVLTGFGGRAQVEPASNPVEFAPVAVGSAGPVETIVLTNNGNLPGSFFIAVIAGGSVGSFQLIDESCSAAAVEPGATCTAQVRFAPQATGPKTARLALFGDDDPTMVMLAGEGLAPPPVASAQALDAAALPAAPGQHRRFAHGKTLYAGQARCHAAKCRKALRARRVAATG
ncbi:MAG TPA: choice-of-anchor D domain-containing protein [Solirubrobacterales bacterium]|nr:choice-of-anchor D domain-containing protein [Solirubrobacterales bacterium]